MKMSLFVPAVVDLAGMARKRMVVSDIQVMTNDEFFLSSLADNRTLEVLVTEYFNRNDGKMTMTKEFYVNYPTS